MGGKYILAVSMIIKYNIADFDIQYAFKRLILNVCMCNIMQHKCVV